MHDLLVAASGANFKLTNAHTGEQIQGVHPTWTAAWTAGLGLLRSGGGRLRYYAAVTPNDSTDLAVVADGVRCTGAGNIAVLFEGDDANNAIVLVSVPADAVGRRGRIKRVRSTSTTATGIEAVYELVV